jgi:hypothetical protein
LVVATFAASIWNVATALLDFYHASCDLHQTAGAILDAIELAPPRHNDGSPHQ